MKKIFLAGVLLALAACTKDADVDEGGGGSGGDATPAEIVFSKESGTWAGTTLPYRKAVIAPRDGELPALVLYLHGGTSRGEDNEKQMSEDAIGVIASYLDRKALNALFLVPQCPSSQKGWDPLISVLRAMLGSFVATGKADASRIYVLGGSMGGTATGLLISTYPDFFAAAMPCAWNPSKCAAAEVARTPFYTVMGTEDNIMSIPTLETFLAAVSDAGGDFRFDKVAGWDHAMTCRQAYTDTRLAWVFSKTR